MVGRDFCARCDAPWCWEAKLWAIALLFPFYPWCMQCFVSASFVLSADWPPLAQSEKKNKIKWLLCCWILPSAHNLKHNSTLLALFPPLLSPHRRACSHRRSAPHRPSPHWAVPLTHSLADWDTAHAADDWDTVRVRTHTLLLIAVPTDPSLQLAAVALSPR